MRRTITEDQVEGNLTYRPFSEKGFIEDLASSIGVVAGGGFTLMGEAVYLHKPMLAIPLERQFEQVMNSRYLEKDGYGKWTRKLDDATFLRGVHPRQKQTPQTVSRKVEEDPHLPKRSRVISYEKPKYVSPVLRK